MENLPVKVLYEDSDGTMPTVEGELVDEGAEVITDHSPHDEIIDVDVHEEPPEPLKGPIADAHEVLNDLHKAEEAAGIKPAQTREPRTPEAQAELEAWEKMSIEIPRASRAEMIKKAESIADPGLRRRTERYSEANWLYEQSDRFKHQAEVAQAHGNNITAAKLLANAAQLYARGTEEYDLADKEYEAYLNQNKNKPQEPKKGVWYTKIRKWFK